MAFPCLESDFQAIKAPNFEYIQGEYQCTQGMTPKKKNALIKVDSLEQEQEKHSRLHSMAELIKERRVFTGMVSEDGQSVGTIYYDAKRLSEEIQQQVKQDRLSEAQEKVLKHLGTLEGEVADKKVSAYLHKLEKSCCVNSEVKRIVSQKLQTSEKVENAVLNKFFHISVFAELKAFFEKTTVSLNARSLSELNHFIDANIGTFGWFQPVDEIVFQVVTDILTSQREILFELGAGGEAVVYKQKYHPELPDLPNSPTFKALILNAETFLETPDSPGPIDEHEAVPSRVNSAHLLALKVLEREEFTESHPEVSIARYESSALLRGSCIRRVKLDSVRGVDNYKDALLMKMGTSTVSDLLAKEPSLGKRLLLILRVAEVVSKLRAENREHFDLKAENIVVTDQNKEVLLIDPSRIKNIGDEIRGGYFSTPGYSSAPEFLLQSQRSTGSGDLWSVGMMLYDAVVALYHPSLKRIMSPLLLRFPGVAPVFQIMNNKHIEVLFPPESSQTYISEIKRELSSLARERYDGDHQQVIDGLMSYSASIDYYSGEFYSVEGLNYSLARLATRAILLKSSDQIQNKELRFVREFFDSKSDHTISQHPESYNRINKAAMNALIAHTFEQYPQELAEICRRPLNHNPQERGTINDLILVLDDFLINHRELMA